MKKTLIKALSVFLCFVFVLVSGSVAFAEDVSQSTTQIEEITKPQQSADAVQKTLEEQRADLAERQKKNEALLSKYQNEAKVCEEYINALDAKIGYLNEELSILDEEVSQAQAKVVELMPQINALNEELKAIQEEYDKAKAEYDKLSERFQTTYDAYCLRLRAMYISGGDSLIVALITSKDLSQFFSRYAMIKAIAKSDTQLLKEVNEEIEVISTKQNGLNEKNAQLTEKKAALDEKQGDYDKQLATIETKQKEIATKKAFAYEVRTESDQLLSEYAAKTQMYGEFRNEDEELINAVESEIDSLLSGLKDPSEVTTAIKGEQTTSKSPQIAQKDGDLFIGSNMVLNLGYPVPSNRSVSASFGYYSNGKPHTGIDYPCPTGSKVVAAQKGIVVTVKRLTYSYGRYVMIYHGTDAKGRKIVTLYAHNSEILVKAGQVVKKGQQIAKSGSTGNSTGPHCHFELIIDGTKTNAKNYLS